MNRDERQNISIKRIAYDIMQHRRSVLVAYMGYGKTKVSLQIIERALIKNPEATFQILVPSLILKEQWQEKTNQPVDTWHSLYNKSLRHVDFVIIDEIHQLINTEEYVKVLQVFESANIIGLSATLEQQHLNNLKYYGFPISDVVGREECEENNWVIKREEYNVKILLDYPTSVRLLELEQIINETMLYLDPTVKSVEEALENNLYVRFTDFQNIIKNREALAQVARYRNTSIGVLYNKIKKVFSAQQEKKALMHNNTQRLKGLEVIMRKHNGESIINFTKSIVFSDIITNTLGGISYHSKIPIKRRKEIVKLYNDGTIKMINTVDAIREGADFNLPRVSVHHGYNSKWYAKEQKDGRIVRHREGLSNVAYVYNLYMSFHPTVNNGMDTNEVYFLKKIQKQNNTNVIWTTLQKLQNA